jgi:hypothetical protein
MDTDETLICTRNIFNDKPTELLSLCRAYDAHARKCDVQAVSDAGLLHYQPIFFLSMSTMDHFYTVNDKSSASNAVSIALSPRYAFGPCPSTIWTDSYWVPVGKSTPSASESQLQALEAVRQYPSDPLTLVEDGILRHVDAMKLCVGATTKHWHKPVDTLGDAHGLMTTRYGDMYRVTRARKVQAFSIHYCRKHASVELLGGIIHRHFADITAKISWAMRRLTKYSTEGHATLKVYGMMTLIAS